MGKLNDAIGFPLGLAMENLGNPNGIIDYFNVQNSNIFLFFFSWNSGRN